MSNKFILFSSGRSGSSFICSTFSAYFDIEGDAAGIELFGSDTSQMQELENPKQKMIEYFEKYKDNKYIGFKWKPYYFDNKYIELFDYLKQNNVKIILNYRNPLHIFFSKKKHENYSIKARYGRKSTENELEEIRKLKVKLDTDKLLIFLKRYYSELNKLINLLKQNDIKFLVLKYEKLANKNIYKWYNVLKYINPEENIKITKLLRILDNPKFKISTFPNTYDKIITNYTEVKDFLIKNNYANLL
tara:strand:- start:131 stop:868 length:738 start_codon:yes stop_codon:yes gene_type:complete